MTSPSATDPSTPASPLATPQRVQLRRTKGWRKPEGCIVCSRPSKYGNPIPIKGDWIMWTAVSLGYRADAPGRRSAAVALYRSWMTDAPVKLGPSAGDTSGGHLEFSDGTETSMNNHCMGIARLASSIQEPPLMPDRPSLDELRGHDLGCWCGLDQPCHVDVLLELSNP